MEKVAAFSLIIFFLYFSFGLVLLFYSIAKHKKQIQFLTLSYILRALLFLGPGLMIYSVNLEWSVWITGPIKVSLIPLTYLFVIKMFRQENVFRTKDLLHFIPFVFDYILTIYVASFYMDEVVRHNPQQENIFGIIWEGNFYYSLLATTARTICLIQSIMYAVKMYPLFKKVLNIQKGEKSNINFTIFHWVDVMILLFVLMGVFDGAAIFGVYQTALGFISWFVFLIINAFFFLLFVLLFSDQDIAIEVSVNNDLVKEEPSEVKCCWKKQFAELELFLYSDLTLQKTSVELNIPKYRLTQLIREEGFDSFYSFVSHYRVEKSKTLLRKLPDLHVIESVIQDSGFKSRSTFFRVFKEFAGITPGQYIKKAQDK